MHIIKESHLAPVTAGHMSRIDDFDLGLAADVQRFGELGHHCTCRRRFHGRARSHEVVLHIDHDHGGLLRVNHVNLHDLPPLCRSMLPIGGGMFGHAISYGTTGPAPACQSGCLARSILSWRRANLTEKPRFADHIVTICPREGQARCRDIMSSVSAPLPPGKARRACLASDTAPWP